MIHPGEMASAEAFAEAERHEELARQCLPGDPFKVRALVESRWWLNEAARLETLELRGDAILATLPIVDM